MSNCLTPDQLERLVTERLEKKSQSGHPQRRGVEECSTCRAPRCR